MLTFCCYFAALFLAVPRVATAAAAAAAAAPMPRGTLYALFTDYNFVAQTISAVDPLSGAETVVADLTASAAFAAAGAPFAYDFDAKNQLWWFLLNLSTKYNHYDYALINVNVRNGRKKEKRNYFLFFFKKKNSHIFFVCAS